MSRSDAVTFGLAIGLIGYMGFLLTFGMVNPLFALVIIVVNAGTCLVLLRRAGAL